jgi:transcriptional regulator CtsR
MTSFNRIYKVLTDNKYKNFNIILDIKHNVISKDINDDNIILYFDDKYITINKSNYVSIFKNGKKEKASRKQPDIIKKIIDDIDVFINKNKISR